MSTISTKKMITPRVVTFTIIILTLIFLTLIQGYATGYEFSRATIGWWVWKHWMDPNTEWAFGVLVLPIVIFILWLKREEIAKYEIKPAYVSGLLLICLACFIYFAGYKANERYFGFFAMHLLIGAITIYFLGWSFFCKTWWVYCTLGMMWPWLFLESPISFRLQLVMVHLTTWFLNLIGDPAVSNGTAIVSQATETLEEGERFQLNIAAACSGMRSLFALVLIGLIFVYTGLKQEWKRWILFFIIPVVAVIANLVRMIFLYLGIIIVDAEFAIGRGEGNESWYHILAGLVVFVVALICLSQCVNILNGGMKNLRKKTVTRIKN